MSNNVVADRSPIDGATLKMVYAPPIPGLIESYCGYSEHSDAPVVRVEPASSRAVIIFGLGDPIRLSPPASPEKALVSFYGALADGPVATRTGGVQSGIQLTLSPVGAYRLVGRTLTDLTNTVVDLADLFGPSVRILEDRLRDSARWDDRFALVDSFIQQRLATSTPVDPVVAWAWQRIQRSGGQVRIEELAQETGWSRKHLGIRLRQQLGASPKLLARLVRLERFTDGARSGHITDLADTALALGYADQAHLNREVKDLTGDTPAVFVSRWSR